MLWHGALGDGMSRSARGVLYVFGLMNNSCRQVKVSRVFAHQKKQTSEESIAKSANRVPARLKVEQLTTKGVPGVLDLRVCILPVPSHQYSC